MEDGTSVGNTLKMHPSGRNEGSTVVIIDESSKSSLCDDDEEREEQVKDHLVANEEINKTPTGNDGHVERFSKDGKYPKREQHPLKEWWKNHILPPTWRLDGPISHCWMIL